MPLVTITMQTGKTAEYRKAVADSVHAALVACFKIPDRDRMQRILELEADCFERIPTMGADAVIVEIRAFAGRSQEAKAALYQTMVANLGQRPGIKPMDVFIIVQDIPKENWGIRGGQMASRVAFDFPTDV